jgi:hypothetical protein
VDCKAATAGFVDDVWTGRHARAPWSRGLRSARAGCVCLTLAKRLEGGYCSCSICRSLVKDVTRCRAAGRRKSEGSPAGKVVPDGKHKSRDWLQPKALELRVCCAGSVHTRRAALSPTKSQCVSTSASREGCLEVCGIRLRRLAQRPIQFKGSQFPDHLRMGGRAT